MRQATIHRLLGAALILAGTLATIAPADAATNRAPQVSLRRGWDGITLQEFLEGRGETLNTLTEQVDVQSWQAPVSGGATFTLVVEVAGNAPMNSIGIYNASQANPDRFLVFPGAAADGWTADCHFSANGHLDVYLYDDHAALQGVTSYTGVDRNNFGFYLDGPLGLFYSQDQRNANGRPQMVTYEGSGEYGGRYWTCFEDMPYDQSDVDFLDSVVLMQSLAPTPTRAPSWGGLKALYR